MKKLLFLVCFFIGVSNALLCAQEAQLDWNKNYRISETSSAEIDQNRSFHIIYFRDAKTSDYGMLPVFESNGTIQEGEILAFETAPKITAFHTDQEKNQLILLVEHPIKKVKKLELVAIDIASGKISSKKAITNRRTRDTFISSADQIVRLHASSDTLTITKIKGEESLNSEAVVIKNRYVFEEMRKKGIQWVNQDQFVKHGSTHPSKVYFVNNRLRFSLKVADTQKTISLSLDKPNEQYEKEFEMQNVNEQQDSSSFIFEEKLFMFFHNVNNIEIEIYDLKSGEGLKRYTLLKDFKKQIDRATFLPLMQQLVQLKYQLTATVNKGLNGNIVIDLDYVDNENYRYQSKGNMLDSNWFHHTFMQQMHQQQIQLQQQQWMNNQINNHMNRGGPNADSYEELWVSPIKKETREMGIKIVLDQDLNIPEDVSTETHFKDIDQDVYIQQLEKTKKARHISILEGIDSFKYLYYSKSDKAFYFGSNAY